MNDSVESASILELTRDNFQAEVLESEVPILIDFWAPWCGPCRAVKPALIEASALLQGTARVGQVNVDEQPELSDAFGVRGIPAFVLMQGTKPLEAFTGGRSAAQMVKIVKDKLGVA